MLGTKSVALINKKWDPKKKHREEEKEEKHTSLPKFNQRADHVSSVV